MCRRSWAATILSWDVEGSLALLGEKMVGMYQDSVLGVLLPVGVSLAGDWGIL